MKKWLFIFALASRLGAQIAVVPNVPAYPYMVLPNSMRQIETNVTVGGSQCAAGADACTVNWTVSATTGGASATFTDPTHTAASSISNALPTVTVNIGSTAGTCSISGSIGSYSVTSTATVTVKATSTDDNTKSGTFTFNVCANSGSTLANGTSSVVVIPAYQQAYQTQKMTLQSYVIGCVDETGTWSITTQPGGGNGTLSDTTYRDTLFSASVTGRYVIKYTSTCTGGNSTAIVYVSPNELPSYSVTPNGTRPHECYVDPALTGADYEIGSGKTYSTIGGTPAITGITAGTIYRLWNTDTTGLSPSVYAEYFQIQQTGTATQPIIFCGVPDSLGNLPIMDGTNATGQSDISTGAAAGYGMFSFWPSSHYGYWQSGSAGPSYISVTGLHIRNATPALNYVNPSGSTVAWGSGGIGGFISAFNIRSGTFIDISGNESDTVCQPVYSDVNSSNAWATFTQGISVMGNNFINFGWTNTGAHGLYLQSFYALVEGNKIGPAGAGYYTSGDGPSNLKWRGTELIARYNLEGANALRNFDLVDDSDGAPYVAFEDYLAPPGVSNCAESMWCDGDTAGANVVAAYQESAQKDLVYGNIAQWTNSGGQMHYGADVSSGMQDRNGVLYFYSNTFWQVDDIFDNINGAGPTSYLAQRFDTRNNIIWPYTGGTIKNFTRFTDIIVSATTNLLETGSISITTPITGGTTAGWSGTSAACSDGSPCDWPLSNPMNTHLPGLGSANYLTTGTQPFTSVTLIPPSGSAAIGAGTALTGLPAQNPVRWQWNVIGGYLVPRTDVLTIGAEDEGLQPPTGTQMSGAFISGGKIQ